MSSWSFGAYEGRLMAERRRRKARRAAVRRLIAAHQLQFDGYYLEELKRVEDEFMAEEA